jgi:hypothetical protein
MAETAKPPWVDRLGLGRVQSFLISDTPVYVHAMQSSEVRRLSCLYFGVS